MDGDEASVHKNETKNENQASIQPSWQNKLRRGRVYILLA